MDNVVVGRKDQGRGGLLMQFKQQVRRRRMCLPYVVSQDGSCYMTQWRVDMRESRYTITVHEILTFPVYRSQVSCHDNTMLGKIDAEH